MFDIFLAVLERCLAFNWYTCSWKMYFDKIVKLEDKRTVLMVQDIDQLTITLKWIGNRKVHGFEP